MTDSTRWSRISASANTDAAYKRFVRDPDAAYSYICIDTPAFDHQNEGSSLRDVEMFGKLATEHPQHPWIVSRAGWAKYKAQFTFAMLRNPDVFEMYTFNNHVGYGVLEMVQNLLLDFEEAKNRWQEQWAVVEAMVLWLLDDGSAPMNRFARYHLTGFKMLTTCSVEYSDLMDAYHLIGRMVLTMLARLDRDDLLGDARSLATVLGMCIVLAQKARDMRVLGEEESRVARAFDYSLDRLCDYVYTYSKQYGAAPEGPSDLDERIADCKKVDLPPPSMNNNDPWGFAASLSCYRSLHSRGMAAACCGSPGIGGDVFDITTWESKDRAKQSFSREDPLDEEDIECIKRGMIISSS